jgi:hypothetical protein
LNLQNTRWWLDPKTLAMILSLSNISLEKEGNEKEKGEICFFFVFL